MAFISNEKIDVIEYEFEILDFIKNHPSGASITDIANEKKYSRNTVSKYVSILELKNLIFSKKVGTSKLFFSTKKSNLPYQLILTYYKMLLKGLKGNYPKNEQIFKKIGREGSKEIVFDLGSKITKQLRALKGHPISKIHFEAFKDFYRSFDILQPNVKISIINNDSQSEKVVYRFKNSEFLERSDDYVYHIYLACGIAEERISRELERPITVEIEKIHIADNKEDSYFDLSVNLK
ncbi:MAG: hypothetical protein ACFFHV_19495 [Promethearchaeota archaeon]